jgi:hypothetical protein
MTKTSGKIHKDAQGTLRWYNAKGWLHRDDGPAKIYADGDQEWYINGKVHRLTGPAVITTKGDQYWYVNGVDITQEVNTWMTENNTSWPWDEHTQALFVLRWG